MPNLQPVPELQFDTALDGFGNNLNLERAIRSGDLEQLMLTLNLYAKALDKIQSIIGLASNPASGSIRNLLANPAPAQWSTLQGVPNSLPLPLISGPMFFLGASYEDELNAYVLSSLGAPYPINSSSNGHSWAYRVLKYLSQPSLVQNTVGRYTGFAGSATGQIYAVAGAGSATSTYDLQVQANLLASDYPSGLPSGSIVVIGAYWPNDLNIALTAGIGGQWPAASGPQTWTVSSTGGFTTTSSGTQNVSVVSSTGAVAGSTNQINFNGANPAGPFVITAVPDGTHITIQMTAGSSGIVIHNNDPIETSSAAYINSITSNGNNLVSALVTILGLLPSNGLIVAVNNPDLSLMPYYSQYNLTTVHNTWLWYQKNVFSQIIANTTAKIAVYDMNPVLQDVVTNYPPTNGIPNKFGFKVVNAGLGGNYLVPVPPTYNADDWAFWDGTTGVTTTGVHPTAAMHELYAIRFLEFLKIRQLLSLG